MKRKILVATASFLLLIGLLIYVFARKNTLAPSGLSTRSDLVNGQNLKSQDARLPNSFPKNSVSHDQALISSEPLVLSGKSLSPGKAYSEVNKLFTEHEAKRSKLLSTSRHGDEIWYLLGVERPAPSEVKKIRKQFSEIQSRLLPKDVKQFDEIVQEMIENYDPFGVLGQRSMLIKVPDDPKSRIRGLTFDSDGFDEDIIRFDPSSPDDYFFRNSVEYLRDDHKIPERFEALLKFDPKDIDQND